MDRIVEIASDDRHLKKDRGFLVVMDGKQEIGRIAMDQIMAVMVHGHGITYSNNLLVALAQQGSLLVLCSSNHAPAAVLCPLDNNSLQGARIRAQWQAKQPLLKQLWKQIVQQKIRVQADCLAAFGIADAPVRSLVRSVKSGDESNVEAQAARRYWPQLMGSDFRRDLSAGAHNAQLNYGYTIMRSMMMRSVVSVGLNPTIGLFHSNRANAFALADDLMEPFRPVVDGAIYHLKAGDETDLTPDIKHMLARLPALDVQFGDVLCPMSQAANRLCHSLVKSFAEGKAGLEFPQFPSPLTLSSLVQD